MEIHNTGLVQHCYIQLSAGFYLVQVSYYAVPDVVCMLCDLGPTKDVQSTGTNHAVVWPRQ